VASAGDVCDDGAAIRRLSEQTAVGQTQQQQQQQQQVQRRSR